MTIKNIHQFLPVLARNDAIGETVLRMKNLIEEWGFDSGIYVEKPIEQTSNLTKHYSKYKEKQTDLIIYHHSIGSELAEFTSNLHIPKVLFYHNVTPPHFFEPYSKTIATELYNGRKQTQTLAKFFDYAMAVSGHNRFELHRLGYKKVLPMQYFMNLERFNVMQIRKDIERKYQNTTKIIFVGRRSPNKKIEDIIKVFAYFKIFNPNSKLFVLGGSWSVERYANTLNHLLDLLHIRDDVIFINELTDEELATYYKISDVFLCMSEHEGFCIPLIESAYFGIPIVAYNSTAVADTLGGTGILVNHKRYPEISQMIELIIKNPQFKESIICDQKERLKFFNEKNAVDTFKNNMDLLISKFN